LIVNNPVPVVSVAELPTFRRTLPVVLEPTVMLEDPD
jgi:hypothetical protein